MVHGLAYTDRLQMTKISLFSRGNLWVASRLKGTGVGQGVRCVASGECALKTQAKIRIKRFSMKESLVLWLNVPIPVMVQPS